MAISKRFFQKSVFICLLMAFMALTCSVSYAEVAPAQKQKLDKINELMVQLSAEGLTEQQKLEVISEILQLTAALADEAKLTGSTELAAEVLNTVSRVADILPGMVQTASADVNVLKSVADLSKTAAQITQTVAETAKETGNKDLGQQTITVAENLKNVTSQITLAAQDIATTSKDENAVNAAKTLIQDVSNVNAIIQSAVTTAKETGASDTAPKAGTTDHSKFGYAQPDEPVTDSKPASPN
ncbi:MAG: hypothetical protein AB7S75_10585 [Desulfococcaceae bacterium]